MTPAQFKALKTGDLVRGRFSGAAFVVTQSHGDRVTAVRTQDLSNPDEWDLVDRDGTVNADAPAPPAPAVPAWRQFPEQVPDPDTECLVEVAFNGALYRAVDTWEMQRYMPVEWSSATVEIGYGWSAHDDVQRWIPISSIAATPAPVAPDDVVKDAARYRWLRDQDYDDGCVIAMKEKHIPRFVNYSQAIDDYIDAAMLSAAPEVKP